MLKFYDINPEYANYLRQFDNRIPNIVYEANNKFVCGIVLSVNKHNYFAPISSSTAKQQTGILIQDDGGNVLSSIKFCFMFPAPNSTISVKDFGAIRALDQSYADLLEKEYAFCKKNEQAIISKYAVMNGLAESFIPANNSSTSIIVFRKYPASSAGYFLLSM